MSRSCRAEITHPVPRPGVADVAGLQRRTEDALAQVWPGCVVRELTALPGGASSLTYAAELSSAPRDRVVVKTTGGEVMAKELKRRTAKTIELKSLNAEHPDRTLAAVDVLWIARILWASQ